MLEYLEKNKEIIVNSLDLVSFTLVTPELLRYSRVGVWFIYWATIPILVTYIVVIPILAISWLITYGLLSIYISPVWNDRLFIAIILILLAIAMQTITNYRNEIRSNFSKIYEWISGKLLLVGVILFFISRFIAF